MGRSAIRASAAFFVHFCVSFLSVMILQLVLVFLTRCSSAQGTTDARLMIKVGCEYDHDPGYVRHAGTSNTIWVQHGDNLPISRDGLPLDDVTNKGFSFYFPSNQQISARNTKTLVWTTGDDALLVDRFVLHAHDDRRSWGYENAYGWFCPRIIGTMQLHSIGKIGTMKETSTLCQIGDVIPCLNSILTAMFITTTMILTHPTGTAAEL